MHDCHDIRRKIRATIERARATGALEPITTSVERVDDQGFGFAIRVASALERKERASASLPADFDPFLPYDPDLFVCDVSDEHVCLLNKFPVLEEHALVVTRIYRDQSERLTVGDFEALWTCMEQFPSLGFYNGGRAAGASQTHKHLQLASLPVCGWKDLPIQPGELAAIGIPHELRAAPKVGWSGEALERAYDVAMSAQGLFERGETLAYNLLITPKELVVIPRSSEKYEGISVNALAFVGSLFVRDEDTLSRVREVGPAAILRGVCPP